MIADLGNPYMLRAPWFGVSRTGRTKDHPVLLLWRAGGEAGA